MTHPLISFVISTHNRRQTLLHTLGRVERCGLRAEQFEVFVVDDASDDGTAEAVASQFPVVKLIRQNISRGPVSKNLALPHARGRFVVFLDDDSYPEPGAVARMAEHFQSDPKLGAAVFAVTLPDGSQECSAYPNVFIGCGTGLRREALEQVGGLPDDFFMQAEEYDLSLRLLDGGWKVRRFDDLHVTHLKWPGARRPARVTELDVRNNVLLIARRFPWRWMVSFGADWLKRYYYIAQNKGHVGSFWRGLLAGLVRSLDPGRRRPISRRAFEEFAKIEDTYEKLKQAQRRLGLRRVLLVDLGKNIHAYWLAAKRCGIEIVAVADSQLAAPGRTYRGIPIVDDATARVLPFDAAIISNLSPVHAAKRLAGWQAVEKRPAIDLFKEGPGKSSVCAAA